MGRILLSQSQVTTLLTSSLIVIFTTLLFLSGYVIQQRTVTGLQAALKPRLPPKPPSLRINDNTNSNKAPEIHPSRLFRDSPDRNIAYIDPQASLTSETDWTRLAHIQLVTTHHDVCNAIMILADLHRLKSPARRLLLFPKEWALEKEGKNSIIADPFLASSRRLLRLAVRRYHVELRPVDPVVEGQDGRSVYSLASAFGFVEFERLLVLERPGLVMDATALDAVLAFTTKDVGVAMLQDGTVEGDGVRAEDLLLFRPSMEMHDELVSSISAREGYNDTLLAGHFSEPLRLASSAEETTLVRSIGMLHDVPGDFNQTAYLSGVSYMRFSDPKLPGPEYDVSWPDKLAARPTNKDADWVWTKLYGEFAQRRMDICGLNLEAYRD